MNAWEHEPDNKKFKASGFQCEIIRHPRLGHLCGYVDLPKGHPLYGKGYYELYEMGIDIDVHGGLTYSDKEGDAWRLGFDCAHLFDLSPYAGFNLGERETYRDMEYVEKETRNLARQLKKVKVKA